MNYVYISILKEIIEIAQIEVNEINDGKCSKWDVNHLVKVIIPEMKELLSYALNGEVFFKYGPNQRLLESSYIIVDSLERLNDTKLGKKIEELQALYNSL